MNDRDRRSLRAFRDEEAERERVEQEQRFAPVRAAESTIRETHRKLAALERERLLTIPDPYQFIDDAVGPNVRMTQAQADTYNREQTHLYRQSHPETYWCDELVESLAGYFSKENIRLVSAAMLERLIARFADVGLLPEKPADPEPESVEAQHVEPAKTEPLIGFDPDTGEEKEFTLYQVNRMSADQYRRIFRVRGSDLLLPNRAAF